MLVGRVDARLEAGGLLGLRDVQEEFEDDGVVVGEGLFPAVDVVHALAGGSFVNEAVDAGREDVFIVRAVEDADHAAGRGLRLAAPEEVVARLERGGDLEAGDVATLRIDAGEDVRDGAVFAGGVHALQDDEQCLLLGGVEDILQDGRAARDFWRAQPRRQRLFSKGRRWRRWGASKAAPCCAKG